MKNILTVFSIIVLAFATNANGQAFQKGDWNVDAGIGFGLYSTITDFSITLPIFGTIKTTEDDGAASVIVPIGVEYGVSNRVGIGLQFGISSYFLDDSTEVKDFFTGQPTGEMEANNTQSVGSFDASLKFNFHLLEAEKNDLYVGLALGASGITWEWKDAVTETLNGSGSYFGLSLNDRIYFSDQYGMFISLGYTGYNYSDVSSSSSNAVLSNLDFKASGVNLATGITIKF